MKKFAFVFAFIMLLTQFSFAQKGKKAEEGPEVPAGVLKAFNAKYRNATKTKWTEESENYRADFKYNDKVMAICYNADAKMQYTEVQVQKAQYNRTMLKYIGENYAGYRIAYVWKHDTYDKKTTYVGMLRKGKEMLEVEFDKKGGFIRDTDKTPQVASKKKSKKTEVNEDEDKPKKNAKVEDEEKEDEGGDNPDEVKPKPAKKEKAKAAPKKTEDEGDKEDEVKPAKEEKAKPAKEPKKEKVKPEPKKKEPKKKKAKEEEEEDDE